MNDDNILSFFKELFKDNNEIKMTDQEKKSTWDGVLRRASDYPNGISPTPGDPGSWDGVLRRKTDFPDGLVPDHIKDKDSQE